MKSTGIKSIVAALAIVLLVSLGALQAQPCMDKPGRGNDGFGPAWRGDSKTRVEHLKEVLELTDDQVKNAEALHVAHADAQLDLRNQIGEKEARLQTLTSAKEVDLKASNKVIDEISTLKASLQKNRIKHHQDVRSILTDDQRVKFDQMHRMGKHGKGKKGKRGHGFGNCDGYGNGNGYGKGNGRGRGGRD